MLSPLDETLHHQLGTTFDHAGTSDPRFFDRYWFAIYDPQGSEPAINTGMCTYLNMNVVDGYVSMIEDGKQYNVRVSDALRPRLFTADPNVAVSGPLSMSVIEPFKRLRLTLADNDSGIAFDVEWKATLAPHEGAAQLHPHPRSGQPGLRALQPVRLRRRLDRTRRGASRNPQLVGRARPLLGRAHRRRRRRTGHR
jgi:hypothetical protein